MIERYVVYSDLDLYLALDNQRALKVQTGAEDLQQAIENIILTKPGARVMQPEFGSRVWYYLFDPVTEETASKIGQAIIDALKLWEPRIQVKKVDIVAHTDEQYYDVTIQFIIKKTGEVVTMYRILRHEAT